MVPSYFRVSGTGGYTETIKYPAPPGFETATSCVDSISRSRWASLRDSLPQRASILRSLARSRAGANFHAVNCSHKIHPRSKLVMFVANPFELFSHFSKKLPLLIIIISIIIIITNITISGGQWNPSFVCI